MAKYSDIKGFTVQTLSTDTIASQFVGGTWSSGGTLNAGHGNGTGFGLQTAAVCCFGGYPTHTNNTETYNGTSWTEVNEGNTARRNLGSFGILTSGLAFGGGPPFGVNLTESWNGTSWTEVNDLPTTVYDNRGIGASSSAGISFGGVDAATPGASKKAHEWNGSSWTAITDMGTIRNAGMGANAGTSTAALAFGGESPSLTVNTELWNGSSWTELNNMNTAKGSGGGNGISTQALAFGGNTAPANQSVLNEFWNGTSWTELADLATGLSSGIAPAGGAVSGLASAGLSNPSTQSTVSQEFDAPAVFNQITEGQLYFNSTTNTFKETITDIPGTAWASGGSLNEARTGLGSSRNASSNASVAAFGGFNASGAPLVARDETELYNGTSWTEVADMNTARGQVGGAGGSSTSAIVFGGEVYPNPSNQTITETWDGSSWTETAEMNTAGRSLGNTGTQTNAFCVAGTPTPSRSTKCELWNGSAWTEVNDYPTAKNYVTVAGIYTAALGVGGTPSPFTEANTWDGTSWTEITSASQHSGTGQGFGAPAPVSMIKVDNDSCEFWNGSSWTEINDLSTARQEGGASGATTNGLVCGGSSPTTGATEEFEVGLANKTITAS